MEKLHSNKLTPQPFRFKHRSSLERLTDTIVRNRIYDGVPSDIDKQAFSLRRREPEKEVNPGNFRLKSFSTIDRLNSMYMDDSKVLDCEVFAPSPKRRFTLAEA